MKCDNCGSNSVEEFVTADSQWCSECGTWFVVGKQPHVPIRSRPAVPVELPDAEGWWWKQNNDGAWDAIWVRGNGSLAYKIGVTGPYPQSRGRYVRAEPPIVATPEPKDEDAEWLRAIFRPAARWSIDDMSRAERIAARLERREEE